eukprot:10503234-Ditylum_brightwellii.AAC.1
MAHFRLVWTSGWRWGRRDLCVIVVRSFVFVLFVAAPYSSLMSQMVLRAVATSACCRTALASST